MKGLVAYGKLAADPCQVELVETIPDDISLQNVAGNNRQPAATDESLINLFDSALRNIKIATPYIALTPPNRRQRNNKASLGGKKVLDALIKAANEGIKIEIVVDSAMQRDFGSREDENILRALGSWTALDLGRFSGYRKMHSKFVLVDDQHFYLGSAKLEWISFSQTKQFGLKFRKCPNLGAELSKIHQYYKLIDSQTESHDLPVRTSALANMENSLSVKLNDNLSYRLLLTDSLASKSSLANDLSSLLRIIDNAQTFIHISMTSYNPIGDTGENKKYWPVLENALKRAAVERGVKVKILFSGWIPSDPRILKQENQIYQSLDSFNSRFLKGSIEVYRFHMTRGNEFQASVPFSRTKHDKYVLTDTALYVGTSNWTEADFESDANVGLVMEHKGKSNLSVLSTIRSMFEREFYSSLRKAIKYQ